MVIRTLLLTLLTIGQIEYVVLAKGTHVLAALVLGSIFVTVICRPELKRLILILAITAFATPMFLAIKIEGVADISRIIWFVLLPIIAVVMQADAKVLNICKLTIYFYTAIGISIILDSVYFLVGGGESFYGVYKFIVPRFYGPFYGPNFMGYIFGVILFGAIALRASIRFYWVHVLVALSCVVLSGSFSAITLVFLLLVFRGFLTGTFLAFFSSGVLVLVGGLCASKNSLLFFVEKLVAGVLSVAGFGNSDLIAKIISFEQRISNQCDALVLLEDNVFGFGRRTIEVYLEKDPHNSYVGIAFEYGIIAYMLLTFSVLLVVAPWNNKRSRLILLPVWFSSLMGLMLNVHYSPIFIFALLVPLILVVGKERTGVMPSSNRLFDL